VDQRHVCDILWAAAVLSYSIQPPQALVKMCHHASTFRTSRQRPAGGGHGALSGFLVTSSSPVTPTTLLWALSNLRRLPGWCEPFSPAQWQALIEGVVFADSTPALPSTQRSSSFDDGGLALDQNASPPPVRAAVWPRLTLSEAAGIIEAVAGLHQVGRAGGSSSSSSTMDPKAVHHCSHELLRQAAAAAAVPPAAASPADLLGRSTAGRALLGDAATVLHCAAVLGISTSPAFLSLASSVATALQSSLSTRQQDVSTSMASAVAPPAPETLSRIAGAAVRAFYRDEHLARLLLQTAGSLVATTGRPLSLPQAASICYPAAALQLSAGLAPIVRELCKSAAAAAEGWASGAAGQWTRKRGKAQLRQQQQRQQEVISYAPETLQQLHALHNWMRGTTGTGLEGVLSDGLMGRCNAAGAAQHAQRHQPPTLAAEASPCDLSDEDRRLTTNLESSSCASSSAGGSRGSEAVVNGSGASSGRSSSPAPPVQPSYWVHARRSEDTGEGLYADSGLPSSQAAQPPLNCDSWQQQPQMLMQQAVSYPPQPQPQPFVQGWYIQQPAAGHQACFQPWQGEWYSSGEQQLDVAEAYEEEQQQQQQQSAFDELEGGEAEQPVHEVDSLADGGSVEEQEEPLNGADSGEEEEHCEELQGDDQGGAEQQGAVSGVPGSTEEVDEQQAGECSHGVTAGGSEDTDTAAADDKDDGGDEQQAGEAMLPPPPRQQQQYRQQPSDCQYSPYYQQQPMMAMMPAAWTACYSPTAGGCWVPIITTNQQQYAVAYPSSVAAPQQSCYVSAQPPPPAPRTSRLSRPGSGAFSNAATTAHINQHQQQHSLPPTPPPPPPPPSLPGGGGHGYGHCRSQQVLHVRGSSLGAISSSATSAADASHHHSRAASLGSFHSCHTRHGSRGSTSASASAASAPSPLPGTLLVACASAEAMLRLLESDGGVLAAPADIVAALNALSGASCQRDGYKQLRAASARLGALLLQRLGDASARDLAGCIRAWGRLGFVAGPHGLMEGCLQAVQAACCACCASMEDLETVVVGLGELAEAAAVKDGGRLPAPRHLVHSTVAQSCAALAGLLAAQQQPSVEDQPGANAAAAQTEAGRAAVNTLHAAVLLGHRLSGACLAPLAQAVIRGCHSGAAEERADMSLRGLQALAGLFRVAPRSFVPHLLPADLIQRLAEAYSNAAADLMTAVRDHADDRESPASADGGNEGTAAAAGVHNQAGSAAELAAVLRALAAGGLWEAAAAEKCICDAEAAFGRAAAANVAAESSGGSAEVSDD